MISVSDARAIILENAKPSAGEQAPLTDALGRTLRETIVASRAQPPFDASAMDGYAVRSADTPGTLRVIGEAGAGRALGRALEPGEAARIFTGAALPAGADSVLIQEDAERAGDDVTAVQVSPGLHVRRAGVDFGAGATLLESGRVLNGAAIALAAAAGRANVRVGQRPRIAILSGGNEIVSPGSTPSADQIFDSVSYGIAALAETWGARAQLGRPFMDDRAAIARRVNDAMTTADVVVIIGGASVGDHDHARPALRAIGAEILFETVSVRPGKPTWFARRDNQLTLGLPGNPASAFVCARLFLRPLIERLLGRNPANACRTQHARLRTALGGNGARETYLRASVQTDDEGQFWAQCFANQDSSLISVFADANALILRPPGAGAVAVGGLVEVMDF
jgi:molybdopterin molybdotransferase